MTFRPGFQNGDRTEAESREPLLRRSAPWQSVTERLPTRRTVALLSNLSAPDRDARPGRQVHLH